MRVTAIMNCTSFNFGGILFGFAVAASLPPLFTRGKWRQTADEQSVTSHILQR